jgi:hypothetical protein
MERNRTNPWHTMASIARPPAFPQVDCPFNQIPCTYCGKVGHLRSKCRDAPKDRAGTAGRDWLWSFSLFHPPVSFKHGLGNPKSLNWTCLNGELIRLNGGCLLATHITRVLIVISVKAYHGRFFGEIFVNKLDPHSIVKLNLDGSCGMYTRLLILFGSC